MNPQAYEIAAKIERASGARGGQELILPEILASLDGCRSIFLPFLSSGTLALALQQQGRLHRASARAGAQETWHQGCPPDADALYFGTPTIVDDRALFPDALDNPHWWNVEREMMVARRLSEGARLAGYRRIVCGLGSGDISLPMRLDAMTGGRAVCWKSFDAGNGERFEDWVCVLELR